MFPYPFRLIAPVHNQQPPSVLLTFSQNRSRIAFTWFSHSELSHGPGGDNHAGLLSFRAIFGRLQTKKPVTQPMVARARGCILPDPLGGMSIAPSPDGWMVGQ